MEVEEEEEVRLEVSSAPEEVMSFRVFVCARYWAGAGTASDRCGEEEGSAKVILRLRDFLCLRPGTMRPEAL